MMKIPDDDRAKIIEHLAWCVATIRAAAVPASRWDRAGIASAMRDVSTRDPAEVFTAACRAAVEPSNRTPAIIALDGPHWSPAAATVNPAGNVITRCQHGVPSTSHCTPCAKQPRQRASHEYATRMIDAWRTHLRDDHATTPQPGCPACQGDAHASD